MPNKLSCVFSGGDPSNPMIRGTFDGQGAKWSQSPISILNNTFVVTLMQSRWGFPGIGYLVRTEDRPRLLHISNSNNVIVEGIFFKNSPYWTFLAENIQDVVIRYSDIDARRTPYEVHDFIDLTAFNTDGFDFSGARRVHIHDVTVWNQDDCICVKDDVQDVMIERVQASGLGLTVGSIGNSVVKNITFRDATMYHTFKGIYMKFRSNGGVVSDVTYENIRMESPEQWPIWIGPAQQSDSRVSLQQGGTLAFSLHSLFLIFQDLCAAHPCSICWPTLKTAECNAPISLYANITLRNVTINNPKGSPGVMLANSSSPMQNVIFEDVVVNGAKPDHLDYFACQNVQGVATGKTSPVPSCFKDLTGGQQSD